MYSTTTICSSFHLEVWESQHDGNEGAVTEFDADISLIMQNTHYNNIASI